MEVLLLREARIRHHAGEIVEVSPAEAHFLITTGSAVEADYRPVIETPEKETAAPETPEETAAPETPEEAEAPRATGKKKK